MKVAFTALAERQITSLLACIAEKAGEVTADRRIERIVSVCQVDDLPIVRNPPGRSAAWAQDSRLRTSNHHRIVGSDEIASIEACSTAARTSSPRFGPAIHRVCLAVDGADLRPSPANRSVSRRRTMPAITLSVRGSNARIGFVRIERLGEGRPGQRPSTVPGRAIRRRPLGSAVRPSHATAAVTAARRPGQAASSDMASPSCGTGTAVLSAMTPASSASSRAVSAASSPNRAATSGA